MLNRDIPPITGQGLETALSNLRSPAGITKEVLFSIIDVCNCEKVFTKEYLHHIHDPACMDWIFRSTGIPTPPRLAFPPPSHPVTPASLASSPSSSEEVVADMLVSKTVPEVLPSNDMATPTTDDFSKWLPFLG